MAADVRATLAQVADVGYGEVEFAGYFGHTPAEVRAWLDAVGLTAPAAHVPFDVVDGWGDWIEIAQVLGHHYLVIPWIPQDRRESLDDYRRVAQEFNELGAAAHDAGLQLAYHNHAFEFTTLEGRTPFDVLLEETDPDLVQIELDLFWTVEGGGDPLDYFVRYPGRFPLVHVKDRTAAGEMVDVGQGIIDFPAIFASSKEAGIKHYFVEHDQPEDSLASIRESHAVLNELLRTESR
jgi:sugar phosphate isomerase/epimerase